MNKILIALSISLAGCSTLTSQPVAAPLASTAIDEKALIIALQTFDTVLTAVDRLVAAGVIKPGSPRAVQIANAVGKTKIAFQAASAAQRAGNYNGYLSGLAQAQVALANINLLLKGN